MRGRVGGCALLNRVLQDVCLSVLSTSRTFAPSTCCYFLNLNPTCHTPWQKKCAQLCGLRARPTQPVPSPQHHPYTSPPYIKMGRPKRAAAAKAEASRDEKKNAKQQKTGLAVGDLLPEFELVNDAEESVKSADLVRAWVVENECICFELAWRAPGCLGMLL